MLVFLKRLILKKVQLFVLYHRDIDDYNRFFGINKDRTIYIPFKVNSLNLIQNLKPVEGEYIFSTGISLRDWKTLALAMNKLNIPLIISIPNDEYLQRSGVATSLPCTRDFDCDLKILRDDGSPESWLRLIAGSKFVVLPISSESINASGISTYLIAMALRKCVVITEGPTTRGILNESNSVIVPPRDPQLLREAIELVNMSTELRVRLADAGYRYAMCCGDTSRLHRDFIYCIQNVANHKNGESPYYPVQ